jgi:transposase
MEDVLDLYAERHDPQRPWVCFDEKPYQLLSDVRPPRPVAPGRAARIDYEYKREGTCNLFLLLDPHRAWRRVTVTAQRAAVDFAHQMRWLVDEGYPEAEVIRVVLDNLSTHTAAALYQAFAPAEARRLARKLAFHYTPKHASWLNMAEIEFSVLERQCLARRLATRADVARETAAWTTDRNAVEATIDWRFTTAHARTKLHRLYPSPTL